MTVRSFPLVLVLSLAGCGANRGAEPVRPDVDDVTAQPHVTPEPTAPGDPAAPVTPTQPGPDPSSPPGATPPAVAEDGPPDPDTLARMQWPANTRSFELRRDVYVYPEPDLSKGQRGKMLEGMRLPVRGSLAGDKKCQIWLAAQPSGWICARHAKASPRPPELIPQPVMPPGALLPQPYYTVREGAARYASEDDVRVGYAKPEPKDKSSYMVPKDPEGQVVVDGATYETTPVGLVAASDLIKEKPSTFAGVDLVANPPPAWPFGFVLAEDRKAVTPRATPDKKAASAGQLLHRAIVPVLEETKDWVRVGDGQWIPRKSVRIARQRPRPAIEGAPAQWIDLDRDEQVLLAYDGDRPVFATLFSSGRRKKDTPPAVYRLRSKTSLTKMAAEERESSHYEVSEVPWATRFRSGLYFHAAYWHDRFGEPRSHGCVNLSPHDARWIYEWTQPVMPPGWSELEVDLATAMVVRVYDAKNMDPPVFDYAKEAVERARLRKEEQALLKAREAAEAIEAIGPRSGMTPAAPPATGP